MDEINLKDLFSYIKSKLVIPILITVVFVTVGSFYSFCLKKPIYSSTASIIVSSDGTTKVTQEDITMSKNLSQTFQEIGTSRQVLTKTISDLNLNESFESLENQISISNNEDTVITRITVSTDNSNRSKTIANSVALNLIEEIKSTYMIENIRMFEEAIESPSPININPIKDEAIYFLLGIIVGFSIILLKLYFSDTEKEIQKIKKKNKKIKISLE